MKSKEKKIEIKKLRKDFRDFKKSKANQFIFQVNVHPFQRISFIYSVIFPGFLRLLFYFRFLICKIAEWVPISTVKIILYRLIGMKIGKKVFISPRVKIDPHFPTFINIGSGSILGLGVELLNHEFSTNRYLAGRIAIGINCVLGVESLIRAGVSIGENSQIGMRAMIRKDIPANSIIKTIEG